MQGIAVTITLVDNVYKHGFEQYKNTNKNCTLMQRYRRMAGLQTREMKATPAIYVPVIYGYNSHLIGWHRRHSALNAQTLAKIAWLDSCARAGLLLLNTCRTNTPGYQSLDVRVPHD